MLSILLSIRNNFPSPLPPFTRTLSSLYALCALFASDPLLHWYAVGGKVEGRTEAAYLGHQHHMVFDNSTNFEGKIERVTSAASRLAGLPCRPRKLGKFILTQPPPPLEDFPVPVEEFHAEKVTRLTAHASEKPC